ncbi:hypothetical protein PVAND_012105 [Polypedilum vanderplanki]|uniref:Uncharacterized protein n=1 Tax=Polypedilum vanderplanki TaxID=319348 RepID=A0A9J6CLE8_POLVA|nr:hypothetical protein PVAND_012105 [Polypedilum vanderplanki]
MASDTKQRPKVKPKTLTLSFNNDDIIVIEDSNDVPVNLNGTFIDLTDENSNKPNDISSVYGNEKKKRTLEFDMMISKDIINLSTHFPQTNVSQAKMIDFNNNPQPSTSKQAIAADAALKATTAKNLELRKANTSRKALELSLHTSAILKELSNTNNTTDKSASTYQKLLEIGKKSLIENQEEFVCSLCNGFCTKGIGVTLKYCLHSFCRPCLIHTINTKTEYGAVKCPLQIENVEKCEFFIDDEEIKELLGVDGYAAFLQNVKLTMEEIADRDQKARDEEELQQSLIPLLLNMDDLETIPNLKVFECPVCFVEINIGEGVVLKNCLHPCCRDCLAGCVAAADDFEVKCPFIHPDDNAPCNERLQEREIRNLVSSDLFDKHLQKSLNVAESANEMTFHCRTLNCPNFVEIDPQITSYICEVCKKQNCISCKAIHEGKSCIDYQEEMNPDLKQQRINNENLQSQTAIEMEIREGKAMYCPRCKIPVQKIAGCDYITCIACKLGICWCTKKPRQTFTKADGSIVEGCKCNEAPRFERCHPKCGNCH